MAKKTAEKVSPPVSKKQLRENIGAEITIALRSYEEVIGKKRFGKTVKKLSKRFAPYVLKSKMNKPVVSAQSKA